MSEVRNYQYRFIRKLILQCSGINNVVYNNIVNHVVINNIVNNVVYDNIQCHIIFSVARIYISQYTVIHNTIYKSLRWQVSAYYKLSKGVPF